jgi:hypothetical protein
MSIKDWFGGDKKKAELREKIKDAVSDGRLSSSDMQEIENLRKELDVEGPGDDKTKLRREIYNEAVGAVRDGGKLGSTETAELAKIQKFLELRDDQVEKTKWNLERFRTLSEIRMGKLPTVASNNVALRGIQWEPGEVPHYCIAAELLDLSVTRGNEGVRIEWGGKHSSGSTGGEGLPLEGAKSFGEGSLIVSSKRLIFKGGKSAAVKYSKDAQIYVYSDGIRLERTIGNAIIKYRSPSEDGAEIVAELVSRFMR